MECLHGKAAASSTTKNGTFWFCGEKLSCEFFCRDEDCYIFTKAAEDFRKSGPRHPLCPTHNKLAKLRTVKDKMKQNYGRPFFVCSERENPCTFWQWGDVYENPRPTVSVNAVNEKSRKMVLTKTGCSAAVQRMTLVISSNRNNQSNV
jgi:hypothetical protein